MRHPSLALVILCLLVGASTGAAAPRDHTYVRERLEALQAAPFADIGTSARRQEVALIWEELEDEADRLPPVYRFVSRFMSRFAARLVLETRDGPRGRDAEAALALLHYAGLATHDLGYQTGSFQPHPIHEPLYQGALARLQGETSEENFRLRLLCMAVFSHSAWSPPLALRTLRDFLPPDGLSLRGPLAMRRLLPFTPALARSLDGDLAAVRQRLHPPPPLAATATVPTTATEPPLAPSPGPPRSGPRLRAWMVLLALALSASAGFAVARRTAPAAPPPAPPAPPAPLAPASPIAPDPARPRAVLGILEALEDVRARVVHSLTGRLAIARVLQDEPERFCEAFLTPETLRESAALLDGEAGLVPMVERLESQDLSRTSSLQKVVARLVGELPRYRKLSAHMRRFEGEVAAGRVPRDVPRFQATLIKVAHHFKEVNQELRAAIGAYRLDTEGLLEERAETFRGRLEVTLDARAETELTTLDRAGLGRDLEVVFDCLLENAFQAKARRLTVTWAATPEAITLVLQDDGAGLAGHDPESLFREGVTTRSLGTGTGLSRCRKLLRARGGSITLAPAEPGGARVTLSLPRSPTET